MRIRLQIERRASNIAFALHKQWRRIENAHAGLRHACLKSSEGRVVDGDIRRCAQGKMLRFDCRLHRHGHGDEINSARCELIAKIDNRLDCVSVRRGCVPSLRHSRRIEKRRPRNVIDIRAIKEPSVPAQVDLLISRMQTGCERELHARQKPLRQDRFLFQNSLGRLDFLRLR